MLEELSKLNSDAHNKGYRQWRIILYQQFSILIQIKAIRKLIPLNRHCP